MNLIKWKKKKWTLVLIPEANQSVVRFRVTNLSLYIALIVLLLILLTSVTVYCVHLRTLVVTERLKVQLSGASKEYSVAMASKEKTIEELQNEIIRLSQQAKDMKTKVEEMTKLEHDLKVIAQIGGDAAAGSGAAPGSGSEGSNADVAQGKGGSLIPVTDEEIRQLSADTSASFLQIGERLTALQSSFAETKQKVLEQQHLLRITPTLWPTSTQVVTSPFGYRKDPLNGRPSFHSGIDIGAHENDPVYATADGTVISAGSDSAHGNNVIISHGQGLKTWYMHLNKILVSEGDSVQKGQKIGLVGSTGRSTGPHLHYEVIKNGQSVDPKPYLQTMRKDEP
jgi:murein DD-endopeptidase MepM/ murein hydrolase activator NlpD